MRARAGRQGRRKRDDRPVLIRETRMLLASMLAAAGVNPSAVTAADVRTTVEVFRRFAALPVDEVAPPEEDGDGILAQFGTFDVRGQREFTADLTRQFIDAGDQDTPARWMRQRVSVKHCAVPGRRG